MATPRKDPKDYLKRGRPTDYNADIAKRICDVVATHPFGYKKLAKMYDDLPEEFTVRLWRHIYPDFSRQYAQAKIAQCELLTEECLDIADDGRNDWMETLPDDEKPAGWKANGEHINRSRLRIDTRKFFAAKLLPKKYGDLAGLAENKDVHDEAMKRADVIEKEY